MDVTTGLAMLSGSWHRGGIDYSSEVMQATLSRLRARFGAPGIDGWWRGLPQVVSELAERWGLFLGEPVARGNTSLVLRCQTSSGERAMLKLTPAWDTARTEADALRHWEPSGRVPHVWGHDADTGALLLEAMPNEAPLSAADDNTPVSMRDIAELITGLHDSGSPVQGDGVISLAERVEFIFELWIERYGRNQDVTRVVSAERLAKGRELASALLSTPDVAPVLLHGDLHPGNVLGGGPARGLVAIDPRPCVGDPAFDAVDWVFWRSHDSRTWELRARELASATQLDDRRVWDWCAALAAMLAAATVTRRGSAGRVDALLSLAP